MLLPVSAYAASTRARWSSRRLQSQPAAAELSLRALRVLRSGPSYDGCRQPLRRSDVPVRRATAATARCAIRGYCRPNPFRPVGRWRFRSSSRRGSIVCIRWRAMSAKSARSRKGGNVTSSVLRRNRRSERKQPLAINSSRSALVAETSRTSTWRLLPPTGRMVQSSKKPQQNGLQRHRHVADFVQEQSAAIGLPKQIPRSRPFLRR